MVALGCVAQAFALQSVLGSDVTATRLFSRLLWNDLVESLGGTIHLNSADGSAICDVPFLTLLTSLVVASAVALIGFAAIFSIVSKSEKASLTSLMEETCRVAVSGWRWWLLPWLWEMARILAFTGGFETTMVMMTALYHYVIAVSLAGWSTSLVVPLFRPADAFVASKPVSSEAKESQQNSSYAVPKLLAAAVVTYIVVFTTMNWQLFNGLLVPHGDSVMYEEHLWNVLHGKGFRSYLDQGLFLGEHIQVIHLALLPFYAIWPSHLLLELFESIALAAGAVPVFWMARRWSESSRYATFLAMAYLLYSPLQFLDIAIDLKTFRPICFGLTAMLFALDQFERGRIKSTVVLFFVALLAKEDFALILAPLGGWILVQPFLKKTTVKDASPQFLTERKLAVKYGVGLMIASVAYLLLTTRILIPWFRDGAEVHYARYFAKFGDAIGEIVTNMLTQPGLLVEELVTIASISYLLALLLPLAFLPLLSPARFCVAAPILALLCLNEIVKGDPQPHHHFHAPVVPVLFWAAAHSLHKFRSESKSRLRAWTNRLVSRDQDFVPCFVLVLCCFVGAVVGMSPLSIRFWDVGSFFHWEKLYVPTERAEKFATVLEQIPMDARVASTDFVHPRFTHHERSYDYSHYLRKVAGYENQVPDDTDFIVIDTRHYYSDIKSPEQVRELRDEPDKWELLEDRSDGYFIVLKRRR